MRKIVLKWIKSILAKIDEDIQKEECDFDEYGIDKIIDELKS
jgi:hypothetical protein